MGIGTIEMMAMLKNDSKLRFQGKSYHGEDVVVYFEEDDGLHWKVDGKIIEQFRVTIWMLQQNWTLVREPVPAWEAIKAWMEGKNVSYVTPEGDEWKIEKQVIFESNRFLNSKWYIND